MSIEVDPENPHVHNANFFENQTQLSFEQTSLYLIHKFNNFSAAIAGCILNFLVVYLILYKTPTHFRAYSKMLLLSGFGDILSILNHFLCQSRLRLSNGAIILSFTGPVGYFPFNIQCKCVALQTMGAILACLLLPSQYLFRFKLIQNRNPPTILQTCLYFCVPLTICIVSVLFSIPGYCSDPETLNYTDFGPFWYVETPIPKLVIGSLTNRALLLYVAFICILVSVCYLLSIWFARRAIVELSKNVQQTDRSREIQRQVGLTLFIQSLIPLCTSFIPVLVTAIATFMQIGIGHASDLIMGTIIWFPALNSLSIIIFIAPYRRACVQKLKGNKIQASTHYSSTHLSHQRNPHS